jgi:hypothetical protein
LLEGDLALANSDGAEAERCFRRALDSAQAQNALTLLLRASTRLTRLPADGDRKALASTELAKIYSLFTEGLETLDSREASAALGNI